MRHIWKWPISLCIQCLQHTNGICKAVSVQRTSCTPLVLMDHLTMLLDNVACISYLPLSQTVPACSRFALDSNAESVQFKFWGHFTCAWLQHLLCGTAAVQYLGLFVLVGCIMCLTLSCHRNAQRVATSLVLCRLSSFHTVPVHWLGRGQEVG